MTKLPSLVSALVLMAILTFSFCDGQIICSTVFPLTGKYAREGGVEEAAMRKAVSDINTKNPVILFGFPAPLAIFSTDSESTVSGALSAPSTFPSSIIVITSSNREIAEAVAPIFMSLSLLHYTLSSSEALTQYPNVVQMVPSERHQGTALADLIHHFNWDFSVGVFSSSTPYGSEILSEFVLRSGDIGLTILASQQFYPGTQELWQIVETVKISQARVIVNIMDVYDMRTIVRHADRLDMLTDKYVWLCSDACATEDLFRDPETNRVDEKMRDKLVGMVGLQFQTGHGELYEKFLDEWEKENPFVFAGAGKRQTTFYAPHAYDAISMFANVLTLAFSSPNASITIESIGEAQKKVQFQGLTGLVKMENGGRERIAVFDIVNLRDDSLKSGFKGFVVVGNWNETEASDHVSDIAKRIDFRYDLQFHDGTYNLPDLDIRNPYNYWSCEDAEEKTDETGKSVRLDKPDGKDAKNIANHYRCDEFIDCYNMSDEWGCPVSFPVLFIVYGIILALLILFAVICLLFTCVFGFCIRRKRIRASSPTFLIIICLAAITGYGGLFAFFGQPHTVSCNFRIWLLAVAVITAISALLVKSFRVWRLYRSPTEIKALKDWQLVLFVIASVVPVLVFLALWTGLATPTAMLLEARKDKEEHLQCSYDSVAGVIGFYFFFFAIVAYVGLFLLFGVFLSIATRNVVSTFNESRLIAISIYNITFSAIVTIPIVFVLKDSDPLITWIIVVTAFAYGFTATLVLQFVPKMWGVVVRDKFGNNTPTQSSTGTSGEHKDSSVGSKDSMAIF